MLTIGEQDFIAADLLDVTEGDDVGTMTLEEFIRRQLRERFPAASRTFHSGHAWS